MGEQQQERDRKYEEKRIVHPEDVRRCAGYVARYICKEGIHLREIENFFLLVAANLGLSWPIDDEYREELARGGYLFGFRENIFAPCPLCTQKLRLDEFLAKVARSKIEVNIGNPKNPSLGRKTFDLYSSP